MKRIPFLKKNDLIYITAPAKAIEEEHVLFAQEFLEKNGFRVRLSSNCCGRHHYFSGTDQERLEDLQAGIDDPEVKAILCARGGYGSVRIVDKVNWAAMLREPKWLLGFSDITVLQQRLLRFEIPSIHATMPLNFTNNTPKSLSTMIDCLRGKNHTIEAEASEHNVLGSVTAPLVGGNLSILYSLLGTDDQVDYAGKILFIEDLAEHLYHLDRMLHSFAKAGIFNRIKGLVIGGMTDMEDTAIPFGKSYEEIILDQFHFHKIPIAFNLPIGHTNDNQAVIVGNDYRFEVSSEGSRLTPVFQD